MQLIQRTFKQRWPASDNMKNWTQMQLLTNNCIVFAATGFLPRKYMIAFWNYFVRNLFFGKLKIESHENTVKYRNTLGTSRYRNILGTKYFLRLWRLFFSWCQASWFLGFTWIWISCPRWFWSSSHLIDFRCFTRGQRRCIFFQCGFYNFTKIIFYHTTQIRF